MCVPLDFSLSLTEVNLPRKHWIMALGIVGDLVSALWRKGGSVKRYSFESNLLDDSKHINLFSWETNLSQNIIMSLSYLFLLLYAYNNKLVHYYFECWAFNCFVTVPKHCIDLSSRYRNTSPTSFPNSYKVTQMHRPLLEKLLFLFFNTTTSFVTGETDTRTK